MHQPLYPLTIFLLAASLFAADSSPFVGTWKLNLAKSKLAGPNPAPKELTFFGEVTSTANIKGTASNGSPISIKYTVPQTGGPVQFLEGGTPGVSAVLAKRKADSRVADWTDTKDGKVIATEHTVVSADGKSFRNTMKGTDPQGKKFERVEVWDRQ